MKTVQTVNIGALSAWYQFSHREDFKRVVPIVSDIMAHMAENIGITIIAREIHNLYIKNKEMTIRTVFKGLSPDKAEKIYIDPNYGMSDWTTLKHWLMAVVDKPFAHPKYAELRDYFALNSTEIGSIYDPYSVLMMLGHFGQRNFFVNYRSVEVKV